MTRQPVNIEDVAARAQQLVDERMVAVREYGTAVNDVTVIRQKLEAAERAQRAAWRTCLRAGWTERQLVATGLPKPAAGPGRPRKQSAPEDGFREPGIASGEGVPDVPEREDDLVSVDPDGDGPPNTVLDRAS